MRTGEEKGLETAVVLKEVQYLLLQSEQWLFLFAL
jgi:hypothetical protein